MCINYRTHSRLNNNYIHISFANEFFKVKNNCALYEGYPKSKLHVGINRSGVKYCEIYKHKAIGYWLLIVTLGLVLLLRMRMWYHNKDVNHIRHESEKYNTIFACQLKNSTEVQGELVAVYGEHLICKKESSSLKKIKKVSVSLPATWKRHLT